MLSPKIREPFRVVFEVLNELMDYDHDSDHNLEGERPSRRGYGGQASRAAVSTSSGSPSDRPQKYPGRARSLGRPLVCDGKPKSSAPHGPVALKNKAVGRLVA